MAKSIRFDVDHKHTPACVTQAGRPDRYTTLQTRWANCGSGIGHGAGSYGAHTPPLATGKQAWP